MNSKELSEMLTLNQLTQKKYLGVEALLTGYRPLKDYPSGEIIGTRVNLTLIGEPSIGQTVTIDVLDKNFSDGYHQGSKVKISTINGVKILGSSRESTTFVNFDLILQGVIKKVD